MVDHRSVYVKIQLFNQTIEAVCDSGASVSCLSSEIFDSLRSQHKLQLVPSNTQLKAANQLPIECRGIVQLPVRIGSKLFNHAFHVLVKSEADCLIGLDFLEDHKCDPLFSKKQLRIEDGSSVPLYHKTYEIPLGQVFRVVAQDTISIPAGYAMVVSASIPGWKRAPVELVGAFEPSRKFNGNHQITAPDMLFKLTGDSIPVVVENSTDTPITVYKNTTLGTSEVIPREQIQNISTQQEQSPKIKPDPKSQRKFEIADEKYDLNHVKASVDKELSTSIKEQFSALVEEFSDIFSKNEWDLGKCDIISHKIETIPGSRPVKLPNRRMPLHHKQDLQNKMDALLAKDLIEPCHSPYRAPAMLVPKKNGKFRLVIDYRQLNDQTIKSCWPIPSIEEIFDTLEGSGYFTTIDMSWGFYQIPMDVKSQDFTAFSTPFGSFKWLRMPMGLTGSPNTFQSLMECVLVGLTWKITVPYLDDCIVFSRTAEEHIERLRLVFERLRAANLKINPTKCEFFRTRVPFLGHIISENGLEPDPAKIEAVQNFPVPRNATEVRSFLGLCSYYRRFVKNFAAIAAPIHAINESKSTFQWTPGAQESFETLKAKLTSPPILAFPSMKEPFILYTDASMLAMGAVLAQKHNGQEKAICYASKALNKAQTRYSATKRELLAVVHFTRHFKHYLLGHKFTIVTDHRALQWLHNFKDPDALTARWLEKLAAFDYEIVHKPGKAIGHADGLSRVPSPCVNTIADETSSCELPPTDNKAREESSKDNHTDARSSSVGSEEWPNRVDSEHVFANPDIGNKPHNYQERNGNLFQATESIAHCVSADFKMSAGLARKIRRKYPTEYPSDIDPMFQQLWPQWLPDEQRYIYHLVTKKKFYNKPTYSALRASLAQMRCHAENNGINRISMPCIGSDLDQLEWTIVRKIIQETFQTSSIVITVYTQEPELPTPDVTKPTSTHDNPMIAAQKADDSLKHVRTWVEKHRVPRNNDLQGLPRLGWQMYNQFHSLYIHEDVLCRKFEPVDGTLPYLQQIVPPALVQDVIGSLHSSSTAGHLGTYKTIEKIRQRFYWPGFKEDVRLFINRCEKCQKRSNPPKTHRHSLVEWSPSYPFHHIGIDFMGPLPLSKGNKHILLIGDHFTKWYEAIPLPDQTALTTANALLEHWICRFGCPHSIHSDQGRNFESQLFQSLSQALNIEKTRTTAYRPQSNAVVERMNRTLQAMLSKCINDEQNNWSQQLPYVMMAYRTSVHESTGYTPHFLVYGNEVNLPVDLMYPNPSPTQAKNVHDYVHTKQQAFQKAYETARTALNFQQKRRNTIYNKKAHGPLYKEGQKVLLHNPAVPQGKSPKFFSSWKGPYVVIKCLNEVTFQIKDTSTQKELVVHYDRLKPFREPPPTSNVPTRNKKTPNKDTENCVPTSNVSTRNQQPSTSTETLQDHDQCTWHFPHVAVPSPVPTYAPSSPRPSATVPRSPATVHFGPTTHFHSPPSRSRTPSPLSTSTPRNHSTGPQASPPSPPTLSSSPETTHSPDRDSVTSTPRSKPWLHEVVDQASRKFQPHEAPQAQPTRTLRSGTTAQRKAQPLYKARLPPEMTAFNSPKSPQKKTFPR